MQPLCACRTHSNSNSIDVPMGPTRTQWLHAQRVIDNTAVAARITGHHADMPLCFAFGVKLQALASTFGKILLTCGVCLCSAASADLVEKSQAAQKLLKVVIAGLSEDAHSEEVRKVHPHPAFVAKSTGLAPEHAETYR